ncbi:MAG: DEAD/DEAH box helicase [Bowdeniella nasicola]|nr:DEAD/DEAH box helicase [Bowdeniella nasicola]
MSRGESRPDPHAASLFAAENLPPAYPARAAWGTAARLRAWQAEALSQFLDALPRDFLAVATPGAGKTTFALRVATELLTMGRVRRVVVVCPTEHLKTQWADAAARVGISLDPAFVNAQGVLGEHFDGLAVTYAQVANRPALHRAIAGSRPTLVILDEIHHGGDARSWGEGIREAYTGVPHRLALTGTPFRSDTSPIPFVTYVPDRDGVRRSRADYSYGYGEALKDGVVRPVIFLSYRGTMRWRTRSGVELSAELAEESSRDISAQALRTALDPRGRWIPAVLAAADQRLSEVRRTVPDAGGLVIASDRAHARSYAAILQQITGRYPVVVLSDDAGASQAIETFTESNDRWMVAVRMVSEGVDVPRLAVGVYATTTSTPLFFAQAVGRFVRARRRGETASIFLPSVPHVLSMAGSLEAERDHALDRDPATMPDVDFLEERALLDAANRKESASDDLFGQFEALDADASFDRVLFDGGEFGANAAVGSVEEQEYLGLPGLLDPEQVATLLRERQSEQLKSERARRRAEKVREQNAGLDEHRRRAKARKELSSLVSQWARRSGTPHALVHAELRTRCGGPEVARATADQIEARIAQVRRWFVGRS